MRSILFLFVLVSAGSVKAQTDSLQISRVDSAIYFHPEISAEYPGGTTAWLHYLQKNMRYPDKAADNEIQGTVIVQFIVDSTGATRDVTAISGPEALRETSINLIKKSGTWVPAINYGRKVNAWKRQPFNYKLEVSK